MMDQPEIASTLYQDLRQHYVALLGQRDVGIRTVVQDLVRGNSTSSKIKFVPLALPLGMDDVEEFKELVIDRLVVATESTLQDAAVSQRQADVLTRYATQTADSRLRRVLDVLAQATQVQQVVIILHTLNKVSTAPLKNLLLLLREYHDLIEVPGEAGYRLRFLVAGEEQLWRLCRHKEDTAISPFNIARILFLDGLTPLQIRGKIPSASSEEAREIATFTGGVPLLVEYFQRLSQEQANPHDSAQYFPNLQPTWGGLGLQTQELLFSVTDGAVSFPSSIPDYQSPQIPDLKDAWSDAFWGGFLRLHDGVLTWRSPIHEAFVRKMREFEAASQSVRATIEERIARLERTLLDPQPPLSKREEAIALARETGNEELADLAQASQMQIPLAEQVARIQQLADNAPSAWLRTYCEIMKRWNADVQFMVLVGIVVGAKRYIRSFDVFMCHNSQDRLSVLPVAEDLVRAGMLPWLDIWEAPAGKQWQMVLEQDIERCKTTAVFVGRSGIGPWQIQEIFYVIDDFTRRNRPIIPVYLPGSRQVSKIPLFLRNYTWLDFNLTGVVSLQQIIDAIRQG
jgi:hypothetical protein